MPEPRLSRNASGELTLDLDSIEAAQYSALCREIARRFDLAEEGKLVAGLDEVFQTWRRGDALIALEWDIWSGFIVAARNPAAEPLLEEISIWLRTRIG